MSPCRNASGTAGSSGGTRSSSAALTASNGFAASIRTCSICTCSRTVDGLAIAVSDPLHWDDQAEEKAITNGRAFDGLPTAVSDPIHWDDEAEQRAMADVNHAPSAARALRIAAQIFC